MVQNEDLELEVKARTENRTQSDEKCEQGSGHQRKEFGEHYNSHRLRSFRIFERHKSLELAGIALTYAGAAIAIWARFSLADNWSGRITLKVGHQLVCSGPYSYVRHPIYSRIVLSVFGTALLVGEWRGLLAIAMVTVAFMMKAKREEAYMTAEFGEGYLRYRQTTGFLVPRIYVIHFKP
ncbi:MAG TPA: isoprenylcysteine carboxylmethyltransferase family protein, partial [Terriglobales bacterium]|nr:isoprenylcysteine carboxylmethyltransferase family protein [Terriglobales bacterium]